MKKTFLAMALAVALPAFAQTAVTAPAVPTPSNPVTVSPNAATALATSTTNRVFVDQSGDNPNINITQDGNSNRQGSAARPVYLRGIDQAVITKQIGNNNEIMLEVKNDTTGTVGASVTIQQIGDSNTIDAACGYGTASTGGTALTGCDRAVINWKFTGDSNSLQFRGTGADQASNITVLGDTNAFYIDAIGDKHTQTLKVTGDSNTFNLNQRSTGAAGSSILVDVTGNNNTFAVSQTGTVDSVLNIKSIANSGTWNITQKN